MSDLTSPLPPTLTVRPLDQPPACTIRVPGSKSITNRALVLAALASPPLRVGPPQGCRLHGALRSEDTEVMVEALRALGFRVRTEWPAATIHVSKEGTRSLIPAREADLFVANSGTTMRFLTALVSLGHGRYRLDGVPRMRQRPIADLLAALRQLGVQTSSEREDGCPPVVVEAAGLHGGHARIKGDVSSQFLSGLLLAAPFAQGDITLEVDGRLVSEPYVEMTLAMLRQWGLRVDTEASGRFHVPGGQRSECGDYAIEPDASGAAYFWGAAAITGGKVRVEGLGADSLQGDVRFAEVLGQMGCRVVRDEGGLAVEGGPLRGIDVDMNGISDTVMTLAAVACCAEGPTVIRNVGHIRHKETDRLAALAAELRRLGAGVEERTDGLRLTPGPLHGALVETYNDHRMAMSLALVGLRVPGVVIRDPGCVAKTYPSFFTDLERLRQQDTKDTKEQ